MEPQYPSTGLPLTWDKFPIGGVFRFEDSLWKKLSHKDMAPVRPTETGWLVCGDAVEFHPSDNDRFTGIAVSEENKTRRVIEFWTKVVFIRALIKVMSTIALVWFIIWLLV